MQLLSVVLAMGLLASEAVAHPGHHAPNSGADIIRRSNLSKRCASAVASMNEKRYNKRNLAKRAHDNATYQITTEAPYYDVIKNDTCVLTPEVTAGPYVWQQSQLLRQDMSEDMAGIPFTLDIGILDMATCEPLENALVDLWHCNATGSYSSFTMRSPDTPFSVLLEQLNVTIVDGVMPDIHTDETTFGRGMWPTDKSGVMEMKTIVPGFYVERTLHIHTQVHTDWVIRDNGTLVSSKIINTGQLYIADDIAEELMALEPYVSHTAINRTTNAVDGIFESNTLGGYNPIIDLVAADGVDMANGVIGYITMGVDTSNISA